jgi:hypothetical protein
MKKLTNKSDTKDALEAFGLEVMGDEHITSKGNLKGVVRNENELTSNIDKVYEYWQQRGFPYYSTDEQYREEQFKVLQSTNFKKLLTKEKVIKPNQVGLSLAWSYMPHSFSIRCGKMRTPMEIYENEKECKNGIRKLLTGSFFNLATVTDLMPIANNLYGEITEISPAAKHKSESTMRTLFRRYTGTQCVSNFRPTAAACLYSHFAFPGALVWDMSMGYGGRILGAIISDINYIGTDPAQKTFKGLEKIKKDFGRSERDYSLNNCGSEVFQPEENSLDFAFTSPPYFDWEKYGEEEEQSFNQFDSNESWNNGFLRKTMQNVYKGLKKDKFMALNVANIKSHKTFENDTVRMAVEEGFKHSDTFKLQLSSQESGAKYEPVFIFQK